MQGTGHRRHPAQVLEPDVQYGGVLLELQGLECLDQQQVPLSFSVLSEHICSAACSLGHTWQTSEAGEACSQARGQLQRTDTLD